MQRSHKSSKSTSKNGGSKLSSKSKEPSEPEPSSSYSRFTPVPLQKSRESSKRKATEKAVSDSDDDAQLSEEAQLPPIKTVKTVKKVCESIHIACQPGSRRTAAKNFFQERRG